MSRSILGSASSWRYGWIATYNISVQGDALQIGLHAEGLHQTRKGGGAQTNGVRYPGLSSPGQLADSIPVRGSMSDAYNEQKSFLTPSQSQVWLGMEWPAVAATVTLSPGKRQRVANKVRLVLGSKTFSQHLWESLIGSLKHAAEVVPLGRLVHCCLSWEGIRAFPLGEQDCLLCFPQHLCPLLQHWLSHHHLHVAVPYVPRPLEVTVISDTSPCPRICLIWRILITFRF